MVITDGLTVSVETSTEEVGICGVDMKSADVVPVSVETSVVYVGICAVDITSAEDVSDSVETLSAVDVRIC